MTSEMIERRHVVAYLKYLSDHAEKGMSADFRQRRPEMNYHAIMLLCAGLRAAAGQLEDGQFDKWVAMEKPE